MKNSTFYIFAWGMYLCCSWMWCIGLFYPVLLHRNFGWGSWFLFTIPNILGAALVPWFIQNAKSSEKFTNRHLFACQCFSFITIIFQFYFIVWIFCSFEHSLNVLLIGFFIFSILIITFRQHVFSASVITFFISFLILLTIPELKTEVSFLIPRENAGLIEGLGLLPVFLIGFFLCPYLDLTFHKVIKECDSKQVKLTFAIAFLGFFLLFLILGTQYYPTAYQMLLGNNAPPYKTIQLLLYAYFILQASFTLVLHMQELSKQKLPKHFWSVLAFILIILAISTMLAKKQILLLGNLRHLREILYICILSFYGLVAPLYMWIFVIISRHEYKLSKTFYNQEVVFLITILVALPLYIIGFFGKLTAITYILPIAVILVMVMKFIVLRLLVLTNTSQIFKRNQ